MRTTFSRVVFAAVPWVTALIVALAVVGSSPGVCSGEPQDEATTADRQRIEGTWRIVKLEINGNKANDEDARKLSVINGPGNTWSLVSEGNVVAKGTNSFDPAKKPKTIDFTITDGSGKGSVFLGIYELGENMRKLCFAPSGKDRPVEFSSASGSEQILVVFERVKQEK